MQIPAGVLAGPATDRRAPISQGALKSGGKLTPELLVVDGLIFKPGQLVRLDVQPSETAVEEGHFAQLISVFLSKAHAGREKINKEAEKVQVITYLTFLRQGKSLSHWFRMLSLSV